MTVMTVVMVMMTVVMVMMTVVMTMMTVVMGMMTVVMVMIIIEEEYSDTIATLSPYICLLAIANGRQPKVMGFPHQ